jgi:thymidylate synthase
MEIHATNTNTLTPLVIDALLKYGVRTETRNGPALTIQEPVTVHLTKPWQRVNLWEARDANPFFHVWEALAMLAGYNSVPFMTWLAKPMGDYSDNGTTYNAFYGTRARVNWGDQIARVITLLRKDPGTRRAVVQLWDPADMLRETKDMACNTSLMFGEEPGIPGTLRMTSTNRSNDAILGGVCGANIVHLSFIHEYVASMAGLQMGDWWHFSNNLHAYIGQPKFPLLAAGCTSVSPQPYPQQGFVHLVGEKAAFDTEIVQAVAMAHACSAWPNVWLDYPFTQPFLRNVAVPMFNAYLAHKRKQPQRSYTFVNEIIPDDWNLACKGWINRRTDK